MSDDSESYLYQLEQVELALSKDPNNDELKKLQHDLQELITLTQQLEQQQQKQQPAKKTSQSPRTPVSPSPQTSSPSTPALKTHQFSVGQEVMARWSGDGQFYRATITAIGGADQVFSVVFRGYSDSEMLKAEDVKALDNKKRQGIFEDVASPKKKKEKTSSSAAPQPKKKKVSEVEVKKNAWLNFASSAENKKKKKKMAATPINKKSIFKTPDNPEGKVGVVGSGRGMTSYQQRGKHLYSDKNDEDD
ncbi:hypothetical protein BJV82DRAFT_672827 [Fennellomyces sp. T-0311]|nr:hypothetical protein BJV82DRAFT_672827 [Fennellomyces sp. T-0311]